jgi:hypothetical protein
MTYNRQDTALSSDTGLAAGCIELLESLRCVGGYDGLLADSDHTVTASQGTIQLRQATASVAQTCHSLFVR